jgi:hypothetical protein
LEDVSRFNELLGFFNSFAEIILANVRLRLPKTNLIVAGRIVQEFFCFFYSVFFSVEVVCFAADVVEDDPVFKESEF